MFLRAHVQIYIESPRKRARGCVFLRIACHRITGAAKNTHILISFSEPLEALPDALELGMVEDLSTVPDSKVIIDFDLAITISFCPSPSWNLFDSYVGQLVSKQQTELTLLMLKRTEKIVTLITCEIALCQYVCELVFGVGVFDLDLGRPSWSCIIGIVPLMIILNTSSLKEN